MRAIFTVVFTVAFTTVAAPALAQSLVVPIDHSMRLGVSGQAASVVVGNPAVADVTVVDSHTLFVSGRGYGETDVVVLDHTGRTIYSGDVIVAVAGAGRASVYRGADRTDMACAPTCSVSTRSPTTPSKEGATSAGGGAGAPSNPLAGLLAGVSGLASGAAAATGAMGKPG
jgi:Flp pilus assembly secretin CpaC